MNRKLLVLVLLFLAVLSLLIIFTFKSVSIGAPIKEEKHILHNVVFVGYENDSCYKTSCTAQFKFNDGVNTYKLKGHLHEIENLVIDSSYDVYYNNFSKEIKSFGFVTN